jgi:hypothetical protein
MPSLSPATRAPDPASDQPPAPLALTDAQITTIMALARPLLPDQRTAFLEMVAAKLRELCNGDVGDGVIYRLCRELQREFFDPPLSHAPGMSSKYR